MHRDREPKPQNFLLEEALATGLSFPAAMEMSFVSVVDGTPLCFRLTADAGGRATFQCDDMETVAEIVQEMCSKLGVRRRSCIPRVVVTTAVDVDGVAIVLVPSHDVGVAADR